MGQGAEIDSHVMRTLLEIAAAKFVMSLTGLACSIILTFWFRGQFSYLERSLHSLCRDIEDRLSYRSLEELTMEQLKSSKEQVGHIRQIGFEMVADLGRSLREELPTAIKNSIGETMAPIVDRVGKMGVDGVGDMVSGLSERLTGSLTAALTQTSEKISHAGDKLELLAAKLDMSSGNIGTQMESAVNNMAKTMQELQHSLSNKAEATGDVFHAGAENLLQIMNTTLEGIRDNTGEGARALSAAAQDMSNAASAFRQEIEMASRESAANAQAQIQQTSSHVSTIIGDTGKDIAETFAKITKDISSQAGNDLLLPLQEISKNIADLLEKLQQGSGNLQHMAENIKNGADASQKAAITFNGAAKTLVEAAMPVKAMTERIELATNQLAQSTHHTAETMSKTAREITGAAQTALNQACEILGHEAQSIEKALAGVNHMLERLKGQGDRLDDMDEKLGEVFDLYTKSVDNAVAIISNHVKEMQKELAPALDTMREVVEQAEQFLPQQRRS